MTLYERPAVAYLLDPLEEGQTFDEWPLHVTLIPPANRDVSDIHNSVKESVRDYERIPITIGQKDFFGDDNSIEAFHIQPERELRELHQAILSKIGGSVAVHDATAEWLGTNYSAHVTIKPGQKRPVTGEEFTFDRLTILGKESGMRIVRHVVRFGNEATS